PDGRRIVRRRRARRVDLDGGGLVGLDVAGVVGRAVLDRVHALAGDCDAGAGLGGAVVELVGGRLDAGAAGVDRVEGDGDGCVLPDAGARCVVGGRGLGDVDLDDRRLVGLDV